ncbi:MAG: DUF2507 domain-containing protein [Zhaonellaceae bacterium]|jgi:predicted hydrocarbon binding protein|nr:DUF2507 domain-containing protein [Clostridia bacterium]
MNYSKISLLAVNQRKELGSQIPLSTFRLLRLHGMQEIFGESTGPALYMVGKSIGKTVEVKTIEEFLELVKELKIGIPSIVYRSEKLIIIKVLECMTCSGLPVTGELFCNFESGFIAGAVEKILGRKAKSTQTKSCSHGDEYCQFEVEIF